MKSFQLFIATIVVAFLFGSCTMEKRLYMPGYHVQWNDNNIKSSKKEYTTLNDERKKILEEEVVIEESNTQLIVSLNEDGYNSSLALEEFNNQKTEVEEIAIAIKQNKKIENKSIALNKVQKTKQHKKPAFGLISGLLLIIVALLLVGLGLIFSSFLGVVGIVFLLIFLIAAVMLFIAGIVKMFRGPN